MGLLQRAIETYDCHKDYVGKYQEGHTVLAPIAHTVTSAALEITLDADGNFCGAAAVDKKEPKILIPVTVRSAGRSGTTICAHPLCDQLCYLTPLFKEKYEDYTTNLTKWEQSEYTHPKVTAVLDYIKKGVIIEDLVHSGLVRLKKDGKPEDEKSLIRWRVLGTGSEDACWKDVNLMQNFIAYNQFVNREKTQNICMVTGEKTQIADQHPKGIVTFNGNAKLISSNDSNGFTYRGRFDSAWQAATIGYEASQKAHNALRWLLSEQGIVFGDRIFLCWNPQGRKICSAAGPFRCLAKPVFKPTDYREALQKTLSGYQAQLPDQAGVVIAAFDAATSGRLALTYYNELTGSDFLQRLYLWDLHCCWPCDQFGIQSPELWRIVNCAFGTQQTEKKCTRMVADKHLVGQQIQRLVSCRVDCVPMPADIMQALKEKASMPLAYEKNIRESILTTACAVIRKYRFDRFKEDWAMALEPQKKDIGYQYGRLLAVLEKAERDTYGNDSDREPNAIRLQSVFCQRPMYTAANIEKQLEKAYFPRLKPGRRMTPFLCRQGPANRSSPRS